jgi:hypothetical protein
MTVPGFTAPATIVPQASCCVFRRAAGLVADGCRDYDLWYPLASVACGIEGYFTGRSATLLDGRCADLPQCRSVLGTAVGVPRPRRRSFAV